MQNHSLKSSVKLDKSVLRCLSLVIFRVGYFDAKYIFRSKSLGSCIFGGFAI